MPGTWPRPSSATSRCSRSSICPSIDPQSTPSFTSSRPSPPTRSTRSSPSSIFSPAISSKQQPEQPLIRVIVASQAAKGPVHLLVDSTGVKLSGPGEWLVEKHGTQRRRAWRKLHLGIDAKTGTIVASTLTSKEVDDAAELGPLLDQVEEPLAAVIADGAYDQDRVYDDVAGHSAGAAVVLW